MSPDDVLEALKELGINTSRSTLLRFENAGAFSTPKRGGGGQGVGRFTEYDEDTPVRFFATWMLMKAEKIPLKKAVAASNFYLGIIGDVSLFTAKERILAVKWGEYFSTKAPFLESLQCKNKAMEVEIERLNDILALHGIKGKD